MTTPALFLDADRPSTAPVEAVRLLEGHGYDRDRVKKWSADRAWATLAQCRRDDAVTKRRADALAVTQDETAPPPRGQPSQLEREIAAKFLGEALAGGIDELAASLLVVVHAFTDDEVRRVGSYLARMLRGEHGQRVASATEGGGVRVRGEGGGWEADSSPIPD
jgi:hypothetical protein